VAISSFWRPFHNSTTGFQNPFKPIEFELENTSGFLNPFKPIEFELENTSGFLNPFKPIEFELENTSGFWFSQTNRIDWYRSAKIMFNYCTFKAK
jgi:hypothetical protein